MWQYPMSTVIYVNTFTSLQADKITERHIYLHKWLQFYNSTCLQIYKLTSLPVYKKWYSFYHIIYVKRTFSGKNEEKGAKKEEEGYAILHT